MRPLVSLILPLAPGTLATIASIQAQSMEDWELLVIAPTGANLREVAKLADPRIHLLLADHEGSALAWNTGLPVARGKYVVFVEPHDLLAVEGLSLLVNAAERSPQGAAFGEYRFTAPIGELPADPLAATGEEVGLADLLRDSPLIPPAQILRRDLLADLRFREDTGPAADLDLFLRLAEGGLRWRRVFGRVASRPLAPLASDRDALTRMWRHLGLYDAVAERRPDVPAPIREDLRRAYVLLAAFARAAGDPRQLAPLVSFGSSFPRWWQRHGFRGPAPRHLLPAGEAFAAPELANLTAERLLEACDPAAAIVLLGLGRNARRIAARLHALGLPVTGRDDGLSAPPAWAAHDRIPVTLVPGSTPYDPRATYIMTVLNDDQYLARLPAGLRIIRWRDMPALLDREWRSAIRDRGATDQPWMPPAPSRGVFAAARNAGLDAARGEFIAFLDADDTLYPGAYATLLDAARAAPQHTAFAAWDDHEGTAPPAPPRLDLDALLGREGIALQAQLIHRDTLAGLRFDPALRHGEDLDLLGRLAIRGVEWSGCGRIVGASRHRPADRSSAETIRRFQDFAAVIRGLFSQARAAGLASTIDLSPDREAGMLHTAALRFAHRTLLDDPTPGKAIAAEIFASVRSPLAITPNLAAQAVRDFQLIDRLDAAEMSRKVRRYTAALAAWWRRCTAEGWAGPGFESAARRAVARELASMQDFSAALLNRCGESRELIILGFGRNGQRLARELARRGLPVTVRDDGLTGDEARARAGNIAITFIDRDEPYDPEPLYLLSVLSDEAYLQRLPRGLDLVRWADHFRHFADDTLARLIRAWPADRGPALRAAA